MNNESQHSSSNDGVYQAALFFQIRASLMMKSPFSYTTTKEQMRPSNLVVTCEKIRKRRKVIPPQAVSFF